MNTENILMEILENTKAVKNTVLNESKIKEQAKREYAEKMALKEQEEAEKAEAKAKKQEAQKKAEAKFKNVGAKFNEEEQEQIKNRFESLNLNQSQYIKKLVAEDLSGEIVDLPSEIETDSLKGRYEAEKVDETQIQKNNYVLKSNNAILKEKAETLEAKLIYAETKKTETLEKMEVLLAENEKLKKEISELVNFDFFKFVKSLFRK